MFSMVTMYQKDEQYHTPYKKFSFVQQYIF